MSETEKTMPMPCPLCGADLLPESDGYEHPADDTCPLDSLYLEQRHLAAWNNREPAQPLTAQDAAPREDDGEVLECLGMDGAKWAAEFRATAIRLGYSDMDEGWLIGWFCNAIMAGHDRRAITVQDAARVVADGLADGEVWRVAVNGAAAILNSGMPEEYWTPVKQIRETLDASLRAITEGRE